jgi:hypothetical protein
MHSSDLTIRKPKVYVDLDGVLANLYGHAQEFHIVETYKSITKDQWEKYFSESNAEELFANLRTFPITNKLLEMVVKMFGGYSILSSPLSFDGPGSIRGKKIWIAKNIKVPSDQDIFDHEKYKYAIQKDGTPNILIDDYKVNIKLWNEHGGIGIKFQSDEDDFAELKEKLKQVVIKTF